MKLFDLHCDTITECYKRNEKLNKNSLDISLEKGKFLEEWKQVYAIWMPDEYRGEEAERYYENVLETFKRETENVSGAILAVEGASALNGKTERIEKLKNDGVKIITVTWNGQNELASGCFAENDTGLTLFGREAVKEMVKNNIVPDVSHLSEKGFYDLCDTTDFPFIASHSDVYEITPHVRNLKDEQIKIISQRGGLIGLNFYNKFLGLDKNSLDMMLKHAEYILNLGAENTLALGSDYDGCSIYDELKGIEKTKDLYIHFEKHLGKTVTDKIFFENAEKYFQTYVY